MPFRGSFLLSLRKHPFLLAAKSEEKRMFSQATTLDKIIRDGKMARFCPSRGFILDLGGGEGGGLLFHFTLFKIVVSPQPRPIATLLQQCTYA